MVPKTGGRVISFGHSIILLVLLHTFEGAKTSSTLPWKQMHTKQEQRISFSIFETRSPLFPLNMVFQAFNKAYNLTLGQPDPSESIFAVGFAEDGRVIEREFLEEFEKTLYVDEKNQAVLRIFRDAESSTNFHVTGYIDGLAILEKETGHVAQRGALNQQNSRWCGMKYPGTFASSVPLSEKPYRLNGLNATLYQSTKCPCKSCARATVELHVLVDASLTKTVGRKQLIAYTPAEQAKIIGNGKIDVDVQNKIMQTDPSFTEKKGDVVSLWIGQELYDLELDPTTGKQTPQSTLGVASGTPGVCKMNNRFNIVQDVGGVFAGVQTVAHEIGHNLGARHDKGGLDKDDQQNEPDDGAENKPPTRCNSNFVMGYDGQGTQRFHKFSPCSQKSIRNYITTRPAYCCVYTDTYKGQPVASRYPGEVVPLTRQCQALLTFRGCTHDANSRTTVVQNCLKYNCPVKKGTQCQNEAGKPVNTLAEILDGTPCMATGGKTGKCFQGICMIPRTVTKKADFVSKGPVSL